jgi:hypothetical protein
MRRHHPSNYRSRAVARLRRGEECGVTDRPDKHTAGRELKEEATSLRIRAESLRYEALQLEMQAERAEERLARLGLRSSYIPPIPRSRGRP